MFDSIKIESNAITNYTHLNSSFCDDLGILSGKSATLLILSTTNDPYHKEHISLSFLEEILSQIHRNIPLTFGHGIAGIGAMIQWMKSLGVLEQGPEELLGDIENSLFELVYSENLRGLDVAEGISGFGFYFLQRVEACSKILNREERNEQYAMYKKCIISLTYQFVKIFKDELRKEYPKPFSYWYGYSGIYLFLYRVHQLGFLELETGAVLASLEKKIILEIESKDANWESLDAYFVFGYIGSTRHIRALLVDDIGALDPNQCPFEYLALRAFQLSFLGEKFDLNTAMALSETLLEKIKFELQSKVIPDLFPFDPGAKSVPMGMERGLAGTALPLISLENGNRKWLEVLGFAKIN
ncbi:hypothetical protein MM213_04555 [Belliella sp. R4-6]|uniref:Lanthionine synthetase C-like protein n=2 Tax=Belliella alkalica TaxID=1730871 RepID=A0ABS9V8I9_9BACT|nr:hypothetical protein [Belliella alkalica]